MKSVVPLPKTMALLDIPKSTIAARHNPVVDRMIMVSVSRATRSQRKYIHAMSAQDKPTTRLRPSVQPRAWRTPALNAGIWLAPLGCFPHMMPRKPLRMIQDCWLPARAIQINRIRLRTASPYVRTMEQKSPTHRAKLSTSLQRTSPARTEPVLCRRAPHRRRPRNRLPRLAV